MRLAIILTLIPFTVAAQPWRASFSKETAIIPGNQAGDTAILTDRFGLERDYVFGSDAVNNGLYAFFLDGGTGVSLPLGAIGGVDGRSSLDGLPHTARGGLVVASATVAGSIVFFTSLPDGGMSAFGPPISAVAPGAVALGDFGDAGAHLFYATGSRQLNHVRLEEDGGAIVVGPNAPVPLPFLARAIAVHHQRNLVYASTGAGGVFEIDVLAEPPRATQIIDAGNPVDIAAGLAVYAQRDGGALLITALQAQDRFRVYRVAPEPLEALGDFIVTAPDGGRQVRGAEFLTVESAPFGGAPDASVFPNGALVICDRNSAAGANYKLVAWEDFANASTPPLPIDPPRPDELVLTPGPVVVRIDLSVPVGPSVDLAWWPSQDVLVTTTNGLTVRSPVDAGVRTQLVIDGGTLGVDALDPNDLVPGGLAIGTSNTRDGGLVFVGPLADGGHALVLSLAVPLSTAVALADFADAGLHLFTATTAGTLARWQLGLSDAGTLTATRRADVTLPGPASTLAAHAKTRTLYLSLRDGVLKLDALAAAPTPEWLVDAGATASSLYAQSDGGALLVTAAPELDRLLVFDPASSSLLAELLVVDADGGRVLRAPVHLDVSSTPMGRFDGGAAWPDGVVAISSTDGDAGTLSLISWGTIARAVTPPLPIDVPGRSTGGGTAGGMATAGGGSRPGGGGRAGGAGGGGIEEPPKGCCNGSPADAVIPAFAFVLWLRSFRRRTMVGS